MTEHNEDPSNHGKSQVLSQKSQVLSQDTVRSLPIAMMPPIAGHKASAIDGFQQRLVDLVNSDFEMKADDKDYKLSHDQLIKVCKILLHKSNNVVLRLYEQKRTMDEEIQGQFVRQDDKTRSGLEEVG